MEKQGETIKLVETHNENVFPKSITNITCVPSNEKSNDVSKMYSLFFFKSAVSVKTL
jgi:hypothetical protein